MDLYMMNCELLATCSALGYLEGDTYHREPDCLESVKDLIRYLRHEDDTRDIRQQLGAGQILQNDLLPIITQHSQDKPLFDACIRLMVNLTQPALLCFGKVPDDPSFRHHFLQVVSYLQAYKEAFANEKVFGVLSETLYNLLQLDWEQRQEEDNLLIERILLLVRNVLHVPADPYEEKNVDDDASVHDKLLWAIHMSGLDDLLKFLASAQSEQRWSLHVLEVISLMFRDQTPELLVSAGQTRSAEEKQRDAQELEALRQKEQAEKRSRTLQRGTRHSRFGGSYVVQGLKSIGDKDVIYHRGLHNFKNYTHDVGKEVRRIPKRQLHVCDPEGQRRSALNVRLFLREFCIDFLENCYNRLMYQVKEGLMREQAQQHDETYYLWALSFFMAFNRGHNFRTDLVSETMSIRTFHFMERNITNYYEMMLTDRKEATSWSRRMHLALKAYRELLLTVNEMDRSRNENIRQSANVIKSNIFYLMEYREIFLTLLRKFDETKQPRSFLRDLVESTHLFLRMLERFCNGRNNLVVQKKRVKRRKRGQKPRPQVENTPEVLEETWWVVSEELRAAGFQLSESLMEGAVPFDAASETPPEEQRAEAMVRVQDALLSKRGPEALGLLRVAREVWPEGDVFGSADVGPEEELQLLKQILFANLPTQTGLLYEDEEGGLERLEEEEELESVHVSETEFNFLDYVKRFASPNIVRPYLLLLKSYSQNSSHTNHCIARMLHRLAVDLKMEALLFQLSVFSLFNKILEDPAAVVYKELVTFAKFVLSRFFALAARNNKVYVELLFWKNVGAVREMTEGYSKPGEGNKGGAKKAKWTPEEEEELRRIYAEHRDSGVPDIVETILLLLSNSSRTRRQVVTQMVAMGLVDSVKDLKKERKGTRIVLWTEQQELELETLFDEYKNTDDVLGNILKRLTARRSRARVVDKLLSMGLVTDRRELYKKRRRNALTKSTGMTEEEFFSNMVGGQQQEPSDEEEEEEEEEEDSEESKDEGEQERPKPRGKEKGSSTRESAGERNATVGAMVQALRQKGMSGPLLWLQNCLNRAADDREEEGVSQAVPLVPLTEENEDAMEVNAFQKLLCKLGVRAPANEQESFWRIPAKLTPAQLRAAATSVSLSHEGGAQEGTAEDQQGVSDNPEQRAQALRALLLARKRKRPAAGANEERSAGEDLASDSKMPEAQEESKTSAKRSRVLDSGEEREEDSMQSHGGDVNPDSDDESQFVPAKRRRQRALIDEDEEED
ncbi:LOW QUALITY PROTEIN: protein timeless homolog [Megalops cyprinoides]|uniref:LOW QUALITY PROTEIN: protein timeless homolog n=1 Tax=Megalops cyprinoides TaxID=118141 RepID=UPI001864033D|nr:LOW QUALITY PROTEIN: protein timeless homolog [Megalops cyprinoides]